MVTACTVPPGRGCSRPIVASAGLAVPYSTTALRTSLPCGRGLPAMSCPCTTVLRGVPCHEASFHQPHLFCSTAAPIALLQHGSAQCSCALSTAQLPAAHPPIVLGTFLNPGLVTHAEWLCTALLWLRRWLGLPLCSSQQHSCQQSLHVLQALAQGGAPLHFPQTCSLSMHTSYSWAFYVAGDSSVWLCLREGDMPGWQAKH